MDMYIVHLQKQHEQIYYLLQFSFNVVCVQTCFGWDFNIDTLLSPLPYYREKQ